jgi:phage terminase large subunit-like protein
MSEDKRLLAAALKRRNRLKKNVCYDAFKLDSRPTKKQEEILRDQEHRVLYVVAGNQSGKSTLGGRLTSWYFQETHPYWERPTKDHCHHCKSTDIEAIAMTNTSGELAKGGDEEYRCLSCSKIWVDWGTEPLTLIVSGKVSKQVTELWEKKIEPFLDKGSYQTFKDGNSLSSVVNKENGNKIIFLSHEKAIKSKDKIQSYVAHFVWIDEMPDHYLYLEEAIQRITSKLGTLICTMTPKTSNPQIKDMIEGVDPSVGIKYKFGKLDNPINQSPEKRAIVLAEIAGQTQAMQNCILYGDWLDAEESVFHLDRDRQVLSTPSGYSTQWEHVAAYDPAANGKGGLIIATRIPTTGIWQVVLADYIDGGKAPSDNIMAIDKKIRPYNITRKIYDCHEAWFILEYEKLRKTGELVDVSPWTAVKKHSRKKELITQLQQIMLENKLVFTPELHELFNEFTSAQWSEGRDDKIKGSQHYHLLDALQYLVDLLPRSAAPTELLSRDAQIMKTMRDSMVNPPKKKHRVGRRRRR